MSESDRTFTVPGADITIIGGATLVFINPDTDVGIEILRCWIGKHGTTTSEELEVNLVTQVTAFPTLTTATPRPHLHGAPASLIVSGTAGAAGTCGIDATVEGAGAKTIIVPDGFNTQNGWLYIPTPEERHKIRAAATSGFGMRLVSTPTELTGWSFGVTFREI